MFGQLLSGLSFVIVLLLVLLYFNYSEPDQKDDESDSEYKKRLDDYNCKHNAQRNFLLVGLGISMVACVYKICTYNKVVSGGENIELMGENEKNLFRGGLQKQVGLPGNDEGNALANKDANIMMHDEDTDSVVSDV